RFSWISYRAGPLPCTRPSIDRIKESCGNTSNSFFIAANALSYCLVDTYLITRSYTGGWSRDSTLCHVLLNRGLPPGCRPLPEGWKASRNRWLPYSRFRSPSRDTRLRGLVILACSGGCFAARVRRERKDRRIRLSRTRPKGFRRTSGTRSVQERVVHT